LERGLSGGSSLERPLSAGTRSPKLSPIIKESVGKSIEVKYEIVNSPSVQGDLVKKVVSTIKHRDWITTRIEVFSPGKEKRLDLSLDDSENSGEGSLGNSGDHLVDKRRPLTPTQPSEVIIIARPEELRRPEGLQTRCVVETIIAEAQERHPKSHIMVCLSIHSSKGKEYGECQELLDGYYYGCRIKVMPGVKPPILCCVSNIVDILRDIFNAKARPVASRPGLFIPPRN
jgi:hypothetical protein